MEAVTPQMLLSALLIFSLRIVDVSLGTLRIGMLVRGKRRWAGVLSFFEALIWLVAAAKVLGTLENPIQFVAYAGGYATGTMVGANIERWLKVGEVVLRVIVPVSAPDVAAALRSAGFFVTNLNAAGRDGEVRFLILVLKRKKLKQALKVIEGIYPQAFVTVEDVTTAQLEEMETPEDDLARRFRMLRK